jgi:acyl dehydratase
MSASFPLAAAASFAGKETGVSDWFEVTQDQIDGFADAVDDHQWIHTAASGPANPFGGPIAHGLLILALSISLARDSGALPFCTWVIYGYDKLRFRAPVLSGKRIRCRTSILDAKDIGTRFLLTVRFKVEIEREKVPALVADCSLLCLDDKGPSMKKKAA